MAGNANWQPGMEQRDSQKSDRCQQWHLLCDLFQSRDSRECQCRPHDENQEEEEGEFVVEVPLLLLLTSINKFSLSLSLSCERSILVGWQQIRNISSQLADLLPASRSTVRSLGSSAAMFDWPSPCLSDRFPAVGCACADSALVVVATSFCFKIFRLQLILGLEFTLLRRLMHDFSST